MILLFYGAMMVAHCQVPNKPAGTDDETIASRLSSGADLFKFTTPEKTWAYYTQGLRDGDPKTALSSLLAGQSKKALSSLLGAMNSEHMCAIADSRVSLKHLPEIDSKGDQREHILTWKTGKELAAYIVKFEFHLACGGLRNAMM